MTARASTRLAIPYPAILGLKKGGFAVLGAGSTKGMARLVDPTGGRAAQELPMEDIAALSSGELVLITRRLVQGLASIPTPSASVGSGPRFCATEAPRSAHVLVASLFAMQLFAL